MSRAQSVYRRPPACSCSNSLLAFVAAPLLTGCGGKPDPNTAVTLIESQPVNLDPRIGVDVQSERIDMLIFDSLVKKDEHYETQPWLAKAGTSPTQPPTSSICSPASASITASRSPPPT